MSIPLLATKLFIPPPASYLINRTCLAERLDECLRSGCRLTLVSAPAGYGKTSLVSSWIHQHPNVAVSWLSLDEQDNEPSEFWAYLVTAVQKLSSGLMEEAKLLLSSGLNLNPEPLLTLIINHLAGITGPGLLVLDDFHLIHQEEIFKPLALMLDRLPPEVHVILLTRSDPHLPLARWRARGQMVEIRLSDLRFSLEETRLLLNQTMGLQLPQGLLETLYTKTEGWVAGLRMAGLALQNLANHPVDSNAVAEFIHSFSGSNRFILDYLLEEVLRQQPVAIQEFLLKTSILEQFCTPLCNALLLSSDGQAVVEYLERENLFLIPLDSERRLYRYHPLFSDLLKKRLRLIHPDMEFELHARASQWYAENHLIHQAVEHAFQAQDANRAANLLEETGEEIFKHGEYRWLLQAIQKLPVAQLQTHWKLNLYQATIYATFGQLSQAENYLQEYETHLQPGEKIATEPDWSAGSVAAVRALIAIFRGDTTIARHHARLALEMIPKDSPSPWRAHLLVALSHINRASSNFVEALQNLEDAIEAGKMVGDIYMTLNTITHMIMMLCSHGRLKRATQLARQGLQYIDQFSLGNTTEASMLFLAWGTILCEQHQLDEAEGFIRRSMETCLRSNIPGMLGWAYQINARYLIAREDLPTAEEAARASVQHVRDVEIPAWIESNAFTLLLQVLIKEGKLAEVEQRLQHRRISASEEQTAFEHTEMTWLGRLLIAKGELDTAEQIIGELYQRAESKGLERLMILSLIHMAILLDARGKQLEAGQFLDKAFDLAEPEEALQLFLDERQALSGLIESAARNCQHISFAQRLAGLLTVSQGKPDSLGITQGQTRPSDNSVGLSKREIEVLRLLAEGFSNNEIAQRLYISLRTVKYHITNIFTKLNVENRTQAVSRARIIKIL